MSDQPNTLTKHIAAHSITEAVLTHSLTPVDGDTAPAIFTYFIQAESGGPIKIGIAKNPIRRVKELQTGHPYKLVLLATIEGNQESELHRRFDEVRAHGEWFYPSKSLIEFVDGLPTRVQKYLPSTEKDAEANNAVHAVRKSRLPIELLHNFQGVKWYPAPPESDNVSYEDELFSIVFDVHSDLYPKWELDHHSTWEEVGPDEIIDVEECVCESCQIELSGHLMGCLPVIGIFGSLLNGESLVIAINDYESSGGTPQQWEVLSEIYGLLSDIQVSLEIVWCKPDGTYSNCNGMEYEFLDGVFQSSQNQSQTKSGGGQVTPTKHPIFSQAGSSSRQTPSAGESAPVCLTSGGMSRAGVAQ